MLSFSHVSVQNLKLYQQKVSRTLGKQQEINTKKKQENKDRTECSTSSQKEKKKRNPPHCDTNIEAAHQWSPVLCLCHSPLNTRRNTNTHHHSTSGSAGSAASPLALLTNRYSNNHLPSVLSGAPANQWIPRPAFALHLHLYRGL